MGRVKVDSSNIENLLRDIKVSLSELKSKQKPSEGFNIFSTLGVELLETRHSKFIAELLNPRGTHGCGSLLLEQFLLLKPIKNKLRNIDLNAFCRSAKVETEQFHIVEKNRSYIDIVIESKNIAIVIENKIYASDQDKQLYRYNKAKMNENYKEEDLIIIYLTLDGKLPSKQSLNNSLTIDNIKLLSYESHIYEWLNNVVKYIEVDNVKSTIKQYLSILEKLTNKNSKEENMEIANKLIVNDNLQTAIQIANALPRAKAIFEMDFYKELQTTLLVHLKDYSIYRGSLNVEQIILMRKPNTKQDNDGFNGLYLYKQLENEKYLFLKIGDDKEYQLYCECFLSSKNDGSKIQRIRKSDFKETDWDVDKDYKILIESEELPDIGFGRNDEIYKKSSDEKTQLIKKTVHILVDIIESEEFKKLEEIMENI